MPPLQSAPDRFAGSEHKGARRGVRDWTELMLKDHGFLRLYWYNLHCKSGLIARLRQVGFETTVPNRIGEVEMRPRQTAFICRKPTC